MYPQSYCADDSNTAVIQKYSLMVYRLAYSMLKNRYDADDIHQEVFVRFLTKRPDFENEIHEKAWFMKVTVNLCKNYWKTAWKRKVVSLMDWDLEEQEVETFRDSQLLEEVQKLPAKYRAVIHLFYYEELSIEEISHVLKQKPSTVRTQLTRARRKLKEVLKEDV